MNGSNIFQEKSLKAFSKKVYLALFLGRVKLIFLKTQVTLNRERVSLGGGSLHNLR